MTWPFWKSKTFWGAIALAVGQVLSAEVIDLTLILKVASEVLIILGIRHGIVKGGTS